MRPKDASPFQCFLCTFVTSLGATLRQHVEREHSRNTFFWCKWCGKASSCIEQFMEHMENELCTETFEHPCGFDGCTYSDTQPSRFIAHLKTTHKGKPLIPCNYCRRLFTLPPCLICHIQNECCNRPTSSSSITPRRCPPAEQAPTSSQESAVSSSTGRNDFPVAAAKTSKVTSILMRKVKASCKTPFSSEHDSDPDDPTWNPFGLNKEFKTANDSDSTTSTLSSGGTSKSVTSSVGRKRKGKAKSKSSKRSRNQEDGEDEESVPARERMYVTWADFFQRITKYKSPDAAKALEQADNIKNFFKCMDRNCRFTCDNNMDFVLHNCKEHNEQKQRCCYCFSSFIYSEKLIKHMLTKHFEQRWQCSNCLYRACSKNHVKLHQKTIHQGEDGVSIINCKRPEIGGIQPPTDSANEDTIEERQTYNCRILGCSFSTMTTTDFRDHFKDKHPNIGLFSCCYCEYECTKLDKLMSHFREHDIHDFECYYCSFGADDSDEVLTHISMNHADKNMQVLSRCSEKSLPAPARRDTTSEEGKRSPTKKDDARSPTKTSADKRHSSRKDDVSPTNKKSISDDSSVKDKSVSCMDKGQTSTMSSDDSNTETMEQEATEEPPLSNEPDNQISDDLSSESNDPLNSTDTTVSKTDQDAASSKQNEETQKEVLSILTCDYCFKVYTYKTSLQKHLKSVHRITKDLQCSICSYSSCSFSHILKHAKECHQDMSCKVKGLPPASPTPSDQFICIFCQKLESYIGDMVKHLYMELDYRKFQCQHCPYHHHQEAQVVSHCKSKHKNLTAQATSTDNKCYEEWVTAYLDAQSRSVEQVECLAAIGNFKAGSDMQCKTCKEQFGTLDLWKSHLYSHLQYNPYQCLLCNKSFVIEQDAEDHIRTYHSASKRSVKVAKKPIERIDRFFSQLFASPLKTKSPAKDETKPKSKVEGLKPRRFPALDDIPEENAQPEETEKKKGRKAASSLPQEVKLTNYEEGDIKQEVSDEEMYRTDNEVDMDDYELPDLVPVRTDFLAAEVKTMCKARKSCSYSLFLAGTSSSMVVTKTSARKSTSKPPQTPPAGLTGPTGYGRRPVPPSEVNFFVRLHGMRVSASDFSTMYNIRDLRVPVVDLKSVML